MAIWFKFSTNINMKKSNKKIVILWSILFFSITLSTTSCRQQKRTCDAENQTELTDANNEFIGAWHSVDNRVYPFGAILIIDENHTFFYDGGACLWHFLSEGSWTLNGDTLILNSFEPEECFYIRRFADYCIIFVKVNDSYVVKREKTSEDCVPNRVFDYIRFANERFVIKDGMLTHIPNPNALCLPEEISEYIFTKMTNDTERMNSIKNSIIYRRMF